MKWTSRAAVFAAFLCLVGTSAKAQMQAPTRGPELKKLDYFIGTWKTDGEMKAPGMTGKFTALDHTEWLDGGFFTINRSKYTAPFGPGSEIEMMGYDPTGKTYVFDSFNSSGEHTSAKGTVDGDTWTWTNDVNMNGQTVKSRFVEHILSPDSYHFTFEASQDGTTWMTVIEGTATRVTAVKK